MKRIIDDHHHDDLEGVYVVALADVHEQLVTVLNEDGSPVMLPDQPLMRQVHDEVHHDAPDDPDSLIKLPYTTMEPRFNGDGSPVLEPVLDENDEPVMLPGQPMQELGHVVVDTYDVKFAADDERWKDRSPEEVAKMQRAEIRKALKARDTKAEKAEARAARARTALPGIGREL